MGEGNKKLSKRDPESNLFHHRDAGFIPEGLLNYLGLLGWSLTADEDVFTTQQFIEAFDIHDVLANPARFDVKKATAINADHIRMLEPQDFRDRLVPYLQAGGVLGETLTQRQEQILDEAAQPARVVVPQHQLSLAIGKEGQNARLAAKLTGWRIDILSESDDRQRREA